MLWDELRREKARIERLKDEVVGRLTDAPDGTLRVSRRGSRAYFYHREEKSDRCGRYIPREKEGLAIRLATKDYDMRLLGVLLMVEERVDALLQALGSAGSCGDGPAPVRDYVEAAYLRLSKERRALVIPHEQTLEEFVKEWESQGSGEKSFFEGDPLLYSDKNERMRSKSEVLIANKLNRYGIPYRYECAFTLEGEGIVYPDFLVLNRKTREMLVWEHLGMMDDAGYALKAMKKIEAYGRCGYIPGVNLILTHERSGCPLDTRVVERLIVAKLI